MLTLVSLVSFFSTLELGAELPARVPVGADLVVVDANVFTSDPAAPAASALAVKDGRFMYVGTDAGARALVGPNTKVIDADGYSILPGFVDNHSHVLWMGALRPLLVDLYAVNSMDELRTTIRSYRAQHPERRVILGVGWRWAYVPGGTPTSEQLDAIDTEPLVLWSNGGGDGWLNSSAHAMMTKRAPEVLHRLAPVVDEAGRESGLCSNFEEFDPLAFFEKAELAPDLDRVMADGIKAALRSALEAGVTTLTDAQIYDSFLPLLLDIHEQGGFADVRLRLMHYVSHHAAEDLAGVESNLLRWRQMDRARGSAHLKMGDGIKLYIDGLWTNHRAALFAPYADQPAAMGERRWTERGLHDMIGLLDRHGYQVATHAVGDRGIQIMVDAYIAVMRANGSLGARHRIEHCELPRPAEIAKMSAFGIEASMQPAHFVGEPGLPKVLGLDRVHELMPWRTLANSGVPISFGTDWMAGPINPIYGLLVASLRVNYEGSTDWGTDERLELKDALRYWTMGSARALRMERDIGSITVGKLADFAIYEEDMTEIDSWWFLLTHELNIGKLDGLTMATFVDGRPVFVRRDVRL